MFVLPWIWQNIVKYPKCTGLRRCWFCVCIALNLTEHCKIPQMYRTTQMLILRSLGLPWMWLSKLQYTVQCTVQDNADEDSAYWPKSVSTFYMVLYQTKHTDGPVLRWIWLCAEFISFLSARLFSVCKVFADLKHIQKDKMNLDFVKSKSMRSRSFSKFKIKLISLPSGGMFCYQWHFHFSACGARCSLQ